MRRGKTEKKIIDLNKTLGNFQYTHPEKAGVSKGEFFFFTRV